MARYQVGDRVVVRSDLSRSERYYMDDPINEHAEKLKRSITRNGNSVTPSMYRLRGSVVTIAGFSGGQYLIAEDRLSWTDEMFEGLESDFDQEFSPFPDIKALFD